MPMSGLPSDSARIHPIGYDIRVVRQTCPDHAGGVDIHLDILPPLRRFHGKALEKTTTPPWQLNTSSMWGGAVRATAGQRNDPPIFLLDHVG